MALCWSLDKIGPMTRSAKTSRRPRAIHGADGKDATAQDRPFHWPGTRPLKELRVGFPEGKGSVSAADMKLLEELGVTLAPITLPHAAAQNIVTMILDVEAATAFDDITRANVRAEIGLWPNTFRRARFISAVDYLRAQRARTLLMRQMAKEMEKFDAYVGPAGFDLALTNLTGHPTVCLPNGFRKNGTPIGLTFTGKLWRNRPPAGESYQDATDHHKKRPPKRNGSRRRKGRRRGIIATSWHRCYRGGG